MKSPFPGMDPYIEARTLWGDFYKTFIVEIRLAINTVLPPGYVARIGQRSFTVLAVSEEEVAGPLGRMQPPSPKYQGNTPAAEPVTLRAFIEEVFEEPFINIYKLEPERRLVTSIEVLSPSNKRRGSAGWKRYLRKRQGLLRGRANLVEIDLLRGGDRMPMLDALPSSPYYVLVARKEIAPTCRVWPAFFDRPLPEVPVPLAKPDPPIPLALQPMVEAVYERSRYGQDIDYSQPPMPPLGPEDAARLKARLDTATKGAKPSPTPRQPRKRRS